MVTGSRGRRSSANNTADGCSRSQRLRWFGGLCLLAIVGLNFILFVVVSNSDAGTFGGGLSGLVMFSSSDPAHRTDVFKGQLKNLQATEWCVEVPFRKGGTATSSFGERITVNRCDTQNKAMDVSAVAAREPMGATSIGGVGDGDDDDDHERVETNGYFLRHIESLSSNLQNCMTGKLAADGEATDLAVVPCKSVQAQWLFTKSKQVVLFDRAATPHELNFRDLNNNMAAASNDARNGSSDGEGTGEGANRAARGAVQANGDEDDAPPPLQCLSLLPVEETLSDAQQQQQQQQHGGVVGFHIGLRPCRHLGDDMVGLQQWDFYETKNTPDMLHDRAFAR